MIASSVFIEAAVLCWRFRLGTSQGNVAVEEDFYMVQRDELGTTAGEQSLHSMGVKSVSTLAQVFSNSIICSIVNPARSPACKPSYGLHRNLIDHVAPRNYLADKTGERDKTR
jgi:hypothetical protein